MRRPDKTRVLRGIGYLRKSRVTMRDRRTKERAVAKGISAVLASLEIQREDIIAECAKERDGYKRVVVGFETDILSGAREDRSGRENIYARVATGEADEIWVWAFDRWSREDEAAAVATIAELRRLGTISLRREPVVVLSVEEPYIDPYDERDEDNSRYNDAVFQAFQRGRHERRRLMERSARGLERARKQGVYLGSVPFGFRPIDGVRANGVEVDPEKVGLLIQMFRLRRSGESLKAISGATGRAETTVQFILHGGTAKRRPMSPDHLARLREAVGPPLFDDVQHMRRGRTFDPTPKYAWLLKGLIRCPALGCERTMIGHASNHRRADKTMGTFLRYYTCADRRTVHGRRSVREDAVLGAVQYDLARITLDPKRHERALALVRSPARQRRVVNYSQRIADLEDDRKAVEKMYRAKRRTYEWWLVEDERLEGQIRELSRLQAMTTEEEAITTRVEDLETIAALVADIDRSDHEEVRLANDALRRMIEHVHIDEHGAATVVWRPVFAGLLASVRPNLRLLPTPAPEPFVSAKRVSEDLAITRRALRTRLLAGDVPGAFTEDVGASTFWRIPRSWLDAELAKRTPVAQP